MNWVWPALVSMTPFAELRAGIPLALASGVNPVLAYITCTLANIIIVPILFFFLEVIHFRLLHVGTYRSLFDLFMERVRIKSERYIQRYGVVGLTILTAIPLPGTGAWTATIAGWFFGMNPVKTFLSVALGIFIAGGLMMGLSLGVITLFF